MNFFKNKKKLILGISVDIFICIFAFIILFLVSKNNTVNTSSPDISATNTTETNNVINTVLDNISSESVPKEEIPEIVTDEKATEKELKEEKVTKKEEKKSNSPYYIKVNYGSNTITIYTKDKDGKYTVPHKAMVCSCGTFTPKSGTYKTSSKYRWGKLIHDVYGQYATRIVGSILFHSVPYSSNKNDALLYNQYDKLGTKASAGCVRLTVADAKWIYDNCPSGTLVEFYKNSNPGPLGKPSAQKIASVEECRNWDPTDPMVGNPWHTYDPEKENNTSNENIIDNSINNTTNSIVNNTTSDNIINNSVNNNLVTDNNINTSTNNNIIDNNTTTNVTNNTTNNNSTTSSNNSITNNSTVDNNIIANDSVGSNNVTINNNTSNTTTNNTIQNNIITNEVNNNIDTNTNENNTSSTVTNNILNTVEPSPSLNNNNNNDDSNNSNNTTFNSLINNSIENNM